MTVQSQIHSSSYKRALRLAEMAALYLLTPLAIQFLAVQFGVPLVVSLATVIALVVLVLSLDESFSWVRAFTVPITSGQLRNILALFAVLGGGLTVLVYLLLPESFLSLPNSRPGLWLGIMLLYPLVSVTAQEIIYRLFFVHRYGPLFAGSLPLAVLVNAGLFAFGHVIFASWVTVIISFAGGVLFAWRYFTGGSFRAVWLEHALYGNLIFTAGLGRYFFTGVPFA